MIVSKPETAGTPESFAVALPICQNPIVLESWWNSVEPVNSEVSWPPMNKDDPFSANSNENWGAGITPSAKALKIVLLTPKLEIAGKANPIRLRHRVNIISKNISNRRPYPSLGVWTKLPVMEEASAKIWFVTFIPAKLTEILISLISLL